MHCNLRYVWDRGVFFLARVFGFALIAVLFCCLLLSVLATMSITFCRFLCLFSPSSSPPRFTPLPCLLLRRGRTLGRMRNLHLVMDCRCVTCHAELAVSLYRSSSLPFARSLYLSLSFFLSITLSLSRSLSMLIYLHPVYLGMLWPWFVNLPLAFCMIAWHFRCKTLNRMPCHASPPPSPSPLLYTVYHTVSVAYTVHRLPLPCPQLQTARVLCLL